MCICSLWWVTGAMDINEHWAMHGRVDSSSCILGGQGISETADTGMDVLAHPPVAIEALMLSDTSFRPLLQHTGDACADSSHPRASGKAGAVHAAVDGVRIFLQDLPIL